MGLKTLQEHFNPASKAVECRYWFAQLYRAITFGNSDQTELEKLGDLIDGQFTIVWHGAVYGFWFDRMKDGEETYVDYQNNTEIKIHDVSQGGIQRILLDKAEQESVQLVQQIGAVEELDEEKPVDDEESLTSEDDASPIHEIALQATEGDADKATSVPPSLKNRE